MIWRTRPFLKWAGGKYVLSERITSILPAGKTLIEAFSGSGAVFLNSDYRSYVLNDVNSDLINCYRALQDHGASFIVDAREYFQSRHNTEARYYRHRQRFNETTDTYERSVLFLYLNRHGYNGLCRYNRAGEFNVPFGKYKAPYFPEEELHLFYVKSKRASFVCNDFRAVLRQARRGAVVYCDPPYVPLSTTAKFTDFAAKGFSLDDQKDLAKEAVAAATRGVPVLISNHDTPFTREIYAGAKIESLKVRRSISCDGTARAPVMELLVLYSERRAPARSRGATRKKAAAG